MATPSPRQLAASRQLLRQILSRRDFVSAGLAAGVGALGLSGCGSDSGPAGPSGPTPPGGTPSGMQVVTGSVTLPTGSTLDPTTMRVDVFTQRVAVGGGGTFSIGLAGGGPALALLVDANGDGVLMALLDPANSSHAVTSRTTAVAMLFYATRAFTLEPAAMTKVAQLLHADPAVAALEQAVASAVARDPHALANGAAGLDTVAMQTLRTMLGSASLREPAPPMPHLNAAAVPTLLRVTPSAPQSGVMVNQDDATASLLITNTRRRPCRVYVYRTAVPTGNPAIDNQPAVLVSGPLELESVEKLDLFTSLKALATFFQGSSPWQPVSLPAMPLDLVPTSADKSNYEVLVLGASPKWVSLDTFEPPIFRDVRFGAEVARWRTDTQKLFAQAVLGDFMLPVLCFFGGVGAIAASHAVIASVVTDAATLGSALFKTIINQLEFGSLGQLEAGLAKTVQEAVSSTTSTQFWKPKIRAVINQASQAALDAESAAVTSSRLLKGAQMFQKVFTPTFLVGIALEAIDFRYVIKDFFDSELGVSWNALLVRQKLNLRPELPRVSPGDRVNFQVSLPANTPTGTFVYEWTHNSPFSTFSAVGEVNVGNAITTSKLFVDLVTTGSEPAPIQVTVVGYDISTSPRQEIGRSGTTVSFLFPAQILPSNATLDPNAQRTFSVVVDGQLPNNAVYRWTLTGGKGSIGGNGIVTTSVPQINYLAGGVSGRDTLHVDVLDPAGTLYAKADVGISVAGPPAISFTIAGNWNPATTPPNGQYSFGGPESERLPSPGGGGLDWIPLAYDLGAPSTDPNDPGQTIGVLISLFAQTGAALREGQVFTKLASGQFQGDGKFEMLLSTMLNDVDNDNSVQRVPIGTGSCKLDSLTQLSSGMFVATYSFSINNGSGGTIVGTGVGRWK